jgi:hypothetical protein
LIVATTRTGVPEAAEVIDRQLSLKEAAKLARKSVDTIRRRLWDDKVPGAFRDGDSQESPWVIPIRGLLEAGLITVADLQEFDRRVDAKCIELEEELVTLTAALSNAVIRLETTERLLAQANGEVEHHRRVAERLLPATLIQLQKGA